VNEQAPRLPIPPTVERLVYVWRELDRFRAYVENLGDEWPSLQDQLAAREREREEHVR
jgi:hypothetical protein